MQITKTFCSELIDQRYDCRKLVAHKVIIGDYPTLTFEQADLIVREYLKNPEPNAKYQIWDADNKIIHVYGMHGTDNR